MIRKLPLSRSANKNSPYTPDLHSSDQDPQTKRLGRTSRVDRAQLARQLAEERRQRRRLAEFLGRFGGSDGA